MSGFAKPEVGKAHAKVMVYGGAGVGKTHFGLTFPKPAVIDTEGGTAFFAGRTDNGLSGDWTVANERGYRAVLGLLEGIESGEVACDSIALDSATSIYTVLSLGLSNDGEKQLSPQDWGKLKARFKAVLDFMYDSLPKHICITAQEKPEYAREGETVRGRVVQRNELVTIGYIPDVDKKAEYACDFVFRITVEGEGKDAVRWFECVKSRHVKFVKGTRYRDLSFASFKDIVAGGAVRTGQTDAQAVAQDNAGDVNRPSDVPFAADAPQPVDQPAAEKAPTLKEMAEEISALLNLPLLGMDADARKSYLASHNNGKASFSGLKLPTLTIMLAELHELKATNEALVAQGLTEAPAAQQQTLEAQPEGDGAGEVQGAQPCDHVGLEVITNHEGKRYCKGCGAEIVVGPAVEPAAVEAESAPGATEAPNGDIPAAEPAKSALQAKADAMAGPSTAAIVEKVTGQPAGTVKTTVKVPDTSGPSTREQRGQIAILRREIAAVRTFTEDEYRGLLHLATGKKTALEITETQADAVIEALRALKSPVSA